MGRGCSKEQLEKLETSILVTLQKDERYNVYTNWRKRTSEQNPFYGQSHTKEAREAQSEANKGKPSSFKGKIQSDEVKTLLSQQNSGSSTK